MRYSLLNFLQCPVSGGELACLTVTEAAMPLAHYSLSECRRINQAGVVVGPLPELRNPTPLSQVLASLAGEPAVSERNREVEVETGLLVCPTTGRWYPIRDFIPELLPDHLRDFHSDFEFLHSLRESIPEAVFSFLNSEKLFTKKGDRDAGAGHKKSEIGIQSKIDDPGFFGPGYLSPFNPHATEHTAHLIKLFAFCLSLLYPTSARVVLDTGSGYSWTTEWLLKSGFEPIGIDITRVYMDVGKTRMGGYRPYMLVGDTENLPIRTACIDAVLGFDSFHHIPDRKRAMRQFERTLKPGGHIILGEPGGAHEHDEKSREVMDKYGILEKGMELGDVRAYVSGTSLTSVQQHHVLKVPHDKMNSAITAEFIAEHRWCAANLFSIQKPVQQSVFSRIGLNTVADRVKALLS
jgi:uncharacterized protein YbaR (Trm112 family)/SAM-dependent methyltransferase